MTYDIRESLLKDAYWFAQHHILYTAISLVDEAFDNFNEFRAWWLTEHNPEYRLYNPDFVAWVGKLMVLFYFNYVTDPDEKMMVALTYSEIYLNP